jgi:hypothetical protein
MPLIQHFRSTTYGRAFLLSSFQNALVTVFAIILKSALDRFFERANVPSFLTTLITFLLTFLAAVTSFYFMHWIFGFGAGMLTFQDNTGRNYTVPEKQTHQQTHHIQKATK